MQKAEMVQRIAEELGCTIGQADAAVAAVLGTVKEALRQGEPVILRRFGTWQVRAKRARVGRNPKTGAAVAIPARRVVCFVVSRMLKQAVAEVGSPAD
jgi:nucleoid DNA-binding protein